VTRVSRSEDAENEKKYAADAEIASGANPEAKESKETLDNEVKVLSRTERWLEWYKGTWMGKTKWSQGVWLPLYGLLKEKGCFLSRLLCFSF